MSRIGLIPIDIPAGVTVQIDGARVSVTGPKGTQSLEMADVVSASVDGASLAIARTEDTSRGKSLHGMTRSLLAGMVIGVLSGYEKQLELEGVGFRAELAGNKLTMLLGYSSPVEYTAPDGVDLSVNGSVITVSGIDKQKVGNAAAMIRSFYPPEPYKGKGVRYKGEHVRRKAGKTVA